MRRYLVIAHKTMGGAHLMEHLHHLREEDPFCRFHLIVPVQHPSDHAWTEGEVETQAAGVLDEMLERMAEMGMGCTGEVGDANPVYAAGVTIRREGADPFTGIVLSTLPRANSRWWRFDVPHRLASAFPEIPVTHVASQEAMVA